jgi:hypothetical protein
MLKVAMAVLIFMFGGCVTTGVMGKQITESQIAALEPGKTTYQEVKARWGEPQSERLHSHGSRQLWVTYSRSVMKSSMSPIAMLVGQSGVKMKYESVSLKFDKNFILIERPTVSKGGSTQKF